VYTTPSASVPVAELGQGGGDESSVVCKRTIYVVEDPAVGCDREWDMGADGDDPAVGEGVRLRRVGGTIVKEPPGRKPYGRNDVCERRCRYLPFRLETRTAAPTERQRVPRETAEGREPVATRGIALDDTRSATLSTATATATGHTEGTCVQAVASQYPQLRLHHHAHLKHLRRHDAVEEDTLQLRPVTARKAWSPWNVPWGDAEGASERGGRRHAYGAAGRTPSHQVRHLRDVYGPAGSPGDARDAYG